MSSKPGFIIASIVLLSGTTHAQDWQPVTGAESLKALFSDTTHTATLEDGVAATANYNADGTGQVNAWGDVFERRWHVQGDEQVCMDIGTETRCFTIEADASDPNTHRATNIATGEAVVFSVVEREVAVAATGDAAGGVSEPSAEEIAAKLANPNAPMASLTFRLQYRTFDGNLPDASSQDGTALMFQPTFPFSLENGDVIFFRPNIPIQLSTPTIDPASGGFKSKSGLGDIVFDVAYGRTTKTGMLYAGGIVASLPTATEDALGTDRYSIGPEFMIGKLTKKYVLGIFPSHMWDVGGSGDADVNLTNIQIFGTYLPGGGWNVGISPIMSYDHNNHQWTIPLNFTFGKTVIWNKRPWKLSAEINYYVKQSDAFGPEWFIGINVAPVVENVLASWFK